MVAEECSWFLGFSTAVWRRFTSQLSTVSELFPYLTARKIHISNTHDTRHTTHTKRNTIIIIHTTQTRVQGFTHYKYDILYEHFFSRSSEVSSLPKYCHRHNHRILKRRKTIIICREGDAQEIAFLGATIDGTNIWPSPPN